jgi:hypothetical protein
MACLPRACVAHTTLWVTLLYGVFEVMHENCNNNEYRIIKKKKISKANIDLQLSYL